MSGFTLYETLRIFVPGALALFLADLVLRMAFGQGTWAADGSATQALHLLEQVSVALAASLLLGLILYSVDLPSRMRIQREGDPPRFRVPTETLGELLRPSSLEAKKLGLYFLLSDRYLALETHKRVYLFGSLFRIFADLRFLLGAALITGIYLLSIDKWTLAPAVSMGDRLQWMADDWDIFSIPALLLLAIGVISEHRHAVNIRNQSRSADQDRRWFREARTQVAEIGPTALVGLALGVVGAIAVGMEGQWRIIAAALAIAGLTLWMWVDIGPPKDLTYPDLRSRALTLLGASRPRTQFTPLQRTLVDVATFAPWFIAADLAYRVAGVDPSETLIWLVLLTPASIIMASGKHEQRLLVIYEDQSTWLDLHRDFIEAIRDSGRFGDSWA
jgi:hypothetical protein